MLLTILFYIALGYVAIRMLIWGIRAAWGLFKILAFVILLPLIIVGLLMAGLVMLAVGVLVLSIILATVGAIVWV